jgi:hypothetical protein
LTLVGLVPADAELAGDDFMQRLRVAVGRFHPLSQQTAMVLAEGPEVSGGLDVEAEDIEPEDDEP